MDAELDGLARDNSPQALKRLGEILRFTSDAPPAKPEERLPVHEKAREALIAKPGHATQYIELLKRSKANAEANLGRVDEFNSVRPFEWSLHSSEWQPQQQGR